jgi:hypothetical protein
MRATSLESFNFVEGHAFFLRAFLEFGDLYLFTEFFEVALTFCGFGGFFRGVFRDYAFADLPVT